MKRCESDWEKELAVFPLNTEGVPDRLKQSVKERISMQRSTQRRRMRSVSAVAVIAVIAALVLIERDRLADWLGSAGQDAAASAVTKEEMTLKVQYFHETTFMLNYGDAFVIKYPNIDVRVVGLQAGPTGDSLGPQSDPDDALAQLMEKEQPDVLSLAPQQYAKLAQEGKVLPLDSWIKQDKYDLDGLHKGVTDYLRDLGGGKLYGLAPTFDTYALYYNKDLFDKYGVPYPTDKMSWDDVFRLAARFPTDGAEDSRVYGFSSSPMGGPYSLAAAVAKTLGLDLIDPAGKKLQLNAGSLRNVWSTVTNGFRQGWIYQAKPFTGTISGLDYYKRSPFVMGRAAMALSGVNLAADLENGKKQYPGQGLGDFNWDIVTEPVDPAAPNDASSFGVREIFAVNAASAHPREAWEMIKLIASDMAAKKNGLRNPLMTLSVHEDAMKDSEGHRLQAFYALTPGARVRQIDSLPEFQAELSRIASAELQQVVDGKETLDEAMSAVQQKGQDALDRAQLAEAAKP